MSFKKRSLVVALALLVAAAARAGEGPRLMEQRTWVGAIDGTILSPSGRLLVTFGDGGAWLWDVESGRQIWRPQLQEEGVRDAVFVSEERLITVHWRATLSWRVDTGRSEPLFADGQPVEHATAVAASRDGRTLAIGSREGTRVLRLPESKVAFSLPPADELALSPDGRWLALAADQSPQPNPPPRALQIWDLSTGRRLDEIARTLPTRRTDHVSVAFSGDSRAVFWIGEEQVDGYDLAAHRARPPLRVHHPRALAASPDGRMLAVGTPDTDDATTLWDLLRGAPLRRLTEDASEPLFFPDSARLVTHSFNRVRLWSADGKLIRRLEGLTSGGGAPSVSAGGRVLAIANSNAEAWIWDLERGRPVHAGEHDPVARSPGRVFPSPDGESAVLDTIHGQELVDARTGRTLRALRSAETDENGSRLLVSPDGKRLLRDGYKNYQTLIDLGAARPPVRVEGCSFVDEAAFSADGSRLACPAEKMLSLIDTASGKAIWRVPTDFASDAGHLDRVAFVAGEARLVSVGKHVRRWDARTGKAAGDVGGEVRSTESSVISDDGRYVATDADGSDGIAYDLVTGKPVAAVNLSYGGAFFGDTFYGGAYRQEGRWQRLVTDLKRGTTRWIDAPFEGMPLQSWLLAGGRFALTRTREGELSIWSLATQKQVCRLFFFDDGAWAVVTPDGRFDTNRVGSLDALHWVLPDQPLRPFPVELFLRDYFEPGLLSRVLAGDALPPVRVQTGLERAQPRVELVRAAVQKDGRLRVEARVQAARAGAAVHDLRLFRDGRLVGQWPAPPTPSPGAAPWAIASRVPLDAGGRAAHEFFIKLPASRVGEKVELSAYAFNADRVKSATARLTVDVPCPPSPWRRPRPRAFVIAAGVSANESPTWKLNYAAADALAVRDALGAALARAGAFDVEPISLLSSEILKLPRDNLSPTKANLRAALARLAAAAAPDDLVVLWFSGHGYGTRDGGFFLFPFDLGADSGSAVDAALLSRAVSADELAAWLGPIDARVVLLIDACQSAAVAGAGFKPGPFGARGLGQLAYDRGMQLVTATQADNVAVGSGALGHSLLTAAFTAALAGRKAARADRFVLADAIDLATAEVPRLYRAYVRSSAPAQVPVTFDYRPPGDDVDLDPRAAADARCY